MNFFFWGGGILTANLLAPAVVNAASHPRQTLQASFAHAGRTPLLLLPELLRNALASLALALGVAALAQRSGSDLSLLQELQSHGQRLQLRRSARRSSTSDADYLRQLSEDGEQK